MNDELIPLEMIMVIGVTDSRQLLSFRYHRTNHI